MDDHKAGHLLTLARCGSKSALEALLRGSAPRLLVAAWGEAHDMDLAEDLTAHAIGEAWHKFRKFRGTTVHEFEGWLLQIMRWMACRARRQRQRESSLRDVAEPPVSVAEPLMDRIVARQVLASLPYASRICLWLKAVGMTSQEIADWLAAREDDRLRTAFTSFPPNERAVNNNLEQTRKRIREMMNAQERTLVEGAATNELR